MVQILGCGMDTIMGHDQKRLPSRILAYSPQEDISSFFTLLASLYPNRFSTLGFLQATLFSSSMSCYPKGLTDSNLGYVVSWFLSLFVSRFLSWFCLLVSLFVCLLVSLLICYLSPSSALMYIVSWFLSLFVSWFLSLSVSHPKKSWRRRGALSYALLASSCYLCPCLLQATLSLGFSRGCPR